MSFSLDDFMDEQYWEFSEDQRGKGVWTVEEAWTAIRPKLDTALADGSVHIDIDAAARKSLRKADQSLVDKGRRAFQRERLRLDQGSLDDGMWLSALMVIGKNERCQLNDIGYEEALQILDTRKVNRDAADAEYESVKEFFQPYLPFLEGGMRLGKVVEMRLVPRSDLSS